MEVKQKLDFFRAGLDRLKSGRKYEHLSALIAGVRESIEAEGALVEIEHIDGFALTSFIGSLQASLDRLIELKRLHDLAEEAIEDHEDVNGLRSRDRVVEGASLSYQAFGENVTYGKIHVPLRVQSLIEAIRVIQEELDI